MDNLRFTSIFIGDNNYKDYKFESNSGFLENLLQVNIFIGKNNAGKSRLLRKLFDEKQIKFLAPLLNIAKINAQIESLYNSIKKDATRFSFRDIYTSIDNIKQLKYLTIKNNFKSFKDNLDTIYSKVSQKGEYRDYIEILDRLSNYQSDFYRLLPEEDTLEFNRIYIPILRGLRPIATTNNIRTSSFTDQDNYLFRTEFDYFKQQDDKETSVGVKRDDIYTGLGLYRDMQKYSHGEPEQREKVKNFEAFLSKTFFSDARVEIIPRYEKDVVYIRIGQDERPIYDLGDGIQALIILTYPLFFRQGETLKVFIEEPELHLHPGYQRIFLETLLRPEFETYQYFITTHSNHLLDMTLDEKDISVYTLRQENDTNQSHKFAIENVENDDLNVLELLGVRNSSVFLSNCTIWVEGITDRIYIRKYLEIIQADKNEKYKEDIHYSFVEYGGNNITHWSFLDDQDTNHPNIGVDKLCGKLFLITDRDKSTFEKGENLSDDASKKAKRHHQLEQKLGDRYYCLQCREVENLLTPDIIKNIIQQREGKNATKLNFSKLSQDAYQDCSLGKFIVDNIAGLTKKYNDGGTISYKDKFAKEAVSFIKTKSDMSSEAIAIAEKLLAFIKSNNY